MRSATPRHDDEKSQSQSRDRAVEPGWKLSRGAAWGRPARLGARLLAWPTLLLVGATFATAACLVGDCPCSPDDALAQPFATLDGSEGASVRALSFAAGAPALASLDENGAIEIRRPFTARRAVHPRIATNRSESENSGARRPLGPARALALSPQGDLLAVSHLNSAVALYRILDRPPHTARTFELDRPTRAAAALAFAPGGAVLAIGQGDGRTTLWNVADGTRIAAINGPRFQKAGSRSSQEDPITSSSSRLPGSEAHTSAGAGIAADGSALASSAFVAALAFSPEGRWLAVASGDRCVRIWGLADGRLVEEFSTPAGVCVDLAFSPDGRALAAAGPAAPIIHLWDVARHRERAALRCEDGPVRGLAISPDGRALAAAGLEGRIDFWDLRTLKRRPLQIEHPGARALAFSPDGRILATGGFDGAIHLWNWPRRDNGVSARLGRGGKAD